MARYEFSFLFMNVVLLVMFISLTFIVFELGGFFFIIELIALAALVLGSFIGMAAVYNSRSWGWIWLAAVSVLVLVDLLAIFLITKTKGFSLTTAIVTAILVFVVSLFNVGGEPEEVEESKKEPKKEEKAEAVEKPKAAAQAKKRGRRKRK